MHPPGKLVKLGKGPNGAVWYTAPIHPALAGPAGTRKITQCMTTAEQFVESGGSKVYGWGWASSSDSTYSVDIKFVSAMYRNDRIVVDGFHANAEKLMNRAIEEVPVVPAYMLPAEAKQLVDDLVAHYNARFGGKSTRDPDFFKRIKAATIKYLTADHYDMDKDSLANLSLIHI